MFASLTGSALARLAVTFALSAAGGAIAYLANMPAPWIAGGLLVVAAASLAGVDTDVPVRLRPVPYLVVGIYSGSGVSEQTLHQMQTWPASFALLALSLVALIGGSYAWLHGRCGWDRNSALLASLPGALSFVLAAAEDLKADMKKVAIAQSLRLLILVELIPLLALLIGHPLDAPAAQRAFHGGPVDLALLFGVGGVLAYVLERLGVPGGWMLGGLLATAVLALGGWAEPGLPWPIAVFGMVGLAAIGGSRFRPGDWALLPAIAWPALGAFAVAMAISAVAAGAVTLMFGINFLQTLLAFAPGALDALIALSYSMSIDPAYVAAHHVARFLALVVAVPLLARWLNRHP